MTHEESAQHDSNQALTLPQLSARPTLLALLRDVADIDLERRNPVDEIRAVDGRELLVFAGGVSGDSYYLVGDASNGPDNSDNTATDGPVLHVTESGEAALIAPTLSEALRRLAQVPFWRDLVHESDESLAEGVRNLEEECEEDVPGFERDQQSLFAELAISEKDAVLAFTSIRTSAAATADLDLRIGPDDLEPELIFD